MRKIVISLLCILPSVVHSATSGTGLAVARSANGTSDYNYNYMYPYLSNTIRSGMPGNMRSELSSNPMDTVNRTEGIPSNTRRVVSRTIGKSARIATTLPTARTATSAMQSMSSNAAARRVVSRPTPARVSANSTNDNPRSIRNQYTRAPTTVNAINTDDVQVSSARCMADYAACMDAYCVRKNTTYNRCYCSAKLSQIDSQYQPTIDSLIKQIIMLKNQSQNPWTDAEMNEWWMDTVGKYTGENSWENLDAALNIDWAGTESRARGQMAFNTGHEYCIQHLNACFYMASNLRDAYRSEISRDCAAYENSLQRLKNAAESIIEAYQ